MSMVVTGSGIDSAECRELRARMRERIQQYDDMDATLKFETEDAFIEFQNNGRTVTPYLTLMGRPVAVEGDFPWDVSGVEYANALDRQILSYRYEFTRENLADLASKGMFEQGFETPEVLRHNLFELPCTVSCVAVGPEGESDFPVVFVSLNPGSLVCDDDMSGYTIHEYFEEMPEQEPEDLVYESAVARTLPYEHALSEFGDKLRVQETEAPEPEAGAAPVDGTIPESPGPAEEAPIPVYEPVEEPVPASEAAGPIDRRAEIEKMGGPDDNPEDGRFLNFDEDELE